MLGKEVDVHEAPGEPSPDDTLYDKSLAAHAREAALRAREMGGPAESGTDLMPETALPASSLPSPLPAFDPVELNQLPREEGNVSKEPAATEKKKWSLLGFLKRTPKEDTEVVEPGPSTPPPVPPAGKSPPRSDDQELQDFFKNLDS
jgi:hypothetical protein